MKLGYFTERPYRWVKEEEVLKNKAFLRYRMHSSIVRRLLTITTTSSTKLAMPKNSVLTLSH